MRWGDKRYHALDYALRQQFGEKVYKVSLNGGFTCPNRDGTLDYRGCIFCSAGGSGDFAAQKQLTVRQQIDEGIRLLRHKKTGHQFIAYFQAYTNTYADPDYLESLYREAVSQPEIAALSIATRPDCLSIPILDVITRIQMIKPVWIELGLQTIHQPTADFIRRGYDLSCFDKAVSELNKRHIPVIVHTILGLPNETPEQMLDTIKYLAAAHIQGIKLQLLHVLKGTDLARYYEETGFHILTLEEYTDILIRCIEHLPPSVVIHRLTGDGPKNLLIEPQWSASKKRVLGHIYHELKIHDTWQGRLYKKGGISIGRHIDTL